MDLNTSMAAFFEFFGHQMDHGPQYFVLKLNRVGAERAKVKVGEHYTSLYLVDSLEREEHEVI